MAETSAVIVPRLNVNDDQAVIVAWRIPGGERVRAGQAIATLETTKVTFDVHADRDGYLGYELEVKSIVAVGTVLAWISDTPGARLENVASTLPSTGQATEPGERFTRKALRRMRELGVTPEELQQPGRIEVADVERFAAARERAKAGTPGDYCEPLEQSSSKIMEAVRLAESYRAVVPSMVTVPISCERVQAKLRELMSDVGPVSLLERVIHETAALLTEFRDLNGFVANGRAWTYREVAIGFAVNAGKSLRVPVVRDTRRLSQLEICRAVRELTLRYFRDELTMADASGGTFTVTDLSAHGVTHFVPVLNDRQSAILGICAEEPRTAHQNLVLAFDHRLSDGMRAGTFLGELRERLQG
jgi:pyruvate/2-oxoglutarate dehydrogenase complex dihydrolipoamide acyltransferase (E2) component